MAEGVRCQVSGASEDRHAPDFNAEAIEVLWSSASAAAGRFYLNTHHLAPDTYFVPTCDTSQTVTPMVAAPACSRIFSCARVKNMETGVMVGVVIVSPVVLSIAILLGASEDWLQRFAELVRSLGRPM